MIMQGKPKVVVHENVVNFPDSEMARILGKQCSGDVSFLAAGPEYLVHTTVLSPDKFGFPTRRQRKYTLCVLQSHAQNPGQR